MTSIFLPKVEESFKQNGIDANIQITIAEQTQDGKRFNRGALLNVGFLYNPNFDVYVFHDVDLLPNDNMLNVYSTKYSQNDIIHFAGGWDRYSGADYIGGVTLIGKNVFNTTNGFPNDYWGWGGEDDEIKRRLDSVGLYNKLRKIRVSNSYRDLEEIETVREKRTTLKSNALELDNIIRTDQAEEHETTWRVNGLNQHVENFYSILDINEDSKNNFISVLIELNYDVIKPKLNERLLRPDLFSERNPESKDSDEDEIVRSITGIAEGSAGYGDVELSTETYQISDAPEQIKNKFLYYFSSFPEELKNRLQMDEAMSFSITEANLAKTISEKILELEGISQNSSIIDATAGAGGNSISFMLHFANLLSIELNEKRCEILKNNLNASDHYLNERVLAKYDVKCGSYNNHVKKTDVIFFDPPWGGVGYMDKKVVQLELGGMLMNRVANSLKDITRYVVMKLPLNYNLEALSSGVAEHEGTVTHEIITDSRNKPKMLLVFIEYPQDLTSIDEGITISELNSMFAINKYVTSYDSYEDCMSNKKQFPYLTNPIIFYKLLESIDLSSFNKKIDIPQSDKLKDDIYQGHFDKETIKNTFNYMFYKIRLGVFIMIKDNSVKYFIPFQNMNYINNWSSFITFADGINNIDEYEVDRSTYIRDSINKNISTWGANNCVLGTWEGNTVGDMGWSEMLEMLIETCANREVNDCVLFYNRRDNPVITKTRTEPYNHIFNGYDTPLEEEFNHETYIPIIGYCKNDNFSDVLVPIYADWRDITGKYYPTSCQNMNVSDINEDWSSKDPIAVFRGSATGCGITADTNDRILVSLISKELREKRGINNIIDAGLTGFNMRDKKISEGNVGYFKYREAGLSNTVDRIPMNTQSNFKYIIHIDGHVSAYRLGKELSLKSCIIKIKSKGGYYVWFSDHLEAFNGKDNLETANYFEVDNISSKLIRSIHISKSRDKIAKKLAENAYNLYTRIMNRDNIYDYTQNVINKISMNFYSI